MRKDYDATDNNRQQSENIILCNQESHISIKVKDRNLTIYTGNEWLGPSQDHTVVLQFELIS